MYKDRKQYLRFILFAFMIMIYRALLMGSVPVYKMNPDSIPHLRKQGNATQLIVDGRPFLMLGGELGNSSASNLEYMKPIWIKLKKMNLNTVLVPVYWELIEPEEGVFDFTLLDSLIHDARQYDFRLVLLWFASWKNSMSCYAPGWVKTNQDRFPRAVRENGLSMEMLSVFSDENCISDEKAFSTLMRHLCEIDSKNQTVIMIQVENEIGMIPNARDHSTIADEFYHNHVPSGLINYLQSNINTLVPEFYQLWKRAGLKKSGTWREVFGGDLASEEVFMAWYFARYVSRITAAGKAEYPLPMYVNAALIRPDYKPGQYPSGGPLPHLMDVWRAGAPEIDFIAPDIYFPNFAEWCIKYHRSGNPLFIPEVKWDAQAPSNVLYAMGQHDAMGFSPFSIESTDSPDEDPIGQCYKMLSRISPLILERQGKGLMAGVLVNEQQKAVEIVLNNCVFIVSHDYTSKWTYKPDPNQWPQRGCIILNMGNDEYLIAGKGVIVTFESGASDDTLIGILKIDEGQYINGEWRPGRRLNGDQSHQGRHLRLPGDKFDIQRIHLYRYQ